MKTKIIETVEIGDLYIMPRTTRHIRIVTSVSPDCGTCTFVEIQHDVSYRIDGMYERLTEGGFVKAIAIPESLLTEPLSSIIVRGSK